MTLALHQEIRKCNKVKIVVEDGKFIVTSENDVKFIVFDYTGNFITNNVKDQYICENIEVSNGNIFHEDGKIVIRGDYYISASSAYFVEKNVQSNNFIDWLRKESKDPESDLADYISEFPTHPPSDYAQGFTQHLSSSKGLIPINVSKFKVAFFQTRGDDMVVCGAI